MVRWIDRSVGRDCEDDEAQVGGRGWREKGGKGDGKRPAGRIQLKKPKSQGGGHEWGEERILLYKSRKREDMEHIHCELA